MSGLKEMQFIKPPCYTIEDFYCATTNFAKFYAVYMVSNCSAECPQECESTDYGISTTFSKYRANSYYYYLLSHSDYLARKYFNISRDKFYAALRTNNLTGLPSLENITATLANKMLVMNINYDELLYTLLEETPKFKIIDLISGMGGTVVNNLLYFSVE